MTSHSATVCVAAILLMVSLPGSAQASDGDRPRVAGSPERSATVAVSLDPTEILWVEASLPAADASQVGIEIYAPKKGKGRLLWQVCKFNFTGAGTYRCGIDMAPGALAFRHSGTWVTSVTIDGTPVAQTRFSVTR